MNQFLIVFQVLHRGLVFVCKIYHDIRLNNMYIGIYSFFVRSFHFCIFETPYHIVGILVEQFFAYVC